MTDLAILHAAVLADPADDAVRLVLADELEELGQVERAEFIRVQVELAKWKPYRSPAEIEEIANSNRLHSAMARKQIEEADAKWNVRRDELRKREGELWSTVHSVFETGNWTVGLNESQGIIGAMMAEEMIEPVAHAIVRRGFVHTVRGPLATLRGGPCEPCLGTGADRASPQVRRDYVCERCMAVSEVPVSEAIRCRHCGSEFMRKHREKSCPTCQGTGRTAGVLRDMVRTQPVERVEVTDADEWIEHNDRGPGFNPWGVWFEGEGRFEQGHWPQRWCATEQDARDYLGQWLLAEARGVPLTESPQPKGR